MSKKLKTIVVAIIVAITLFFGQQAAYAVTGIQQHYIDINGPSFLGYATTEELGTDQTCAPGGRYVNYQYGAIHWVPGYAASETHGAIRNKWIASGYECGVAGFPRSDEFGSSGPTGRQNFFHSQVFGDSAIYYVAGYGTFISNYTIYAKYHALGETYSRLGAPRSDIYFNGYDGGGNPSYKQNFGGGWIITTIYYGGSHYEQVEYYS